MIARAVRAIQDAWDSYFSFLYYPILCTVGVLVWLYNRWYARKLADDWEQWTIADWLISYAPGFVRRGLSGEMLLFLSRQTGRPPNELVLWTIVTLLAVFVLTLALLLARRRVTFWYFALCLSPGFILFTFYNPAAVGRKELLVFVAFVLWTLFSGGYRRGVRFHLAFAVAAFLLTLMHEMFVFFSPYFVLLAYLVAKERNGPGAAPDAWATSLLVPAASIIATLLVLGYSASIEDPALCERLLRLGAPMKVCEGVLQFHNPTLGEGWSEFAAGLNPRIALSLIAIFPLALIPFAVFLAASVATPRSVWRITGLAALTMLCSSPLFVLAIDWGRWIGIHVVLLTLTGAAFLPKRSEPKPARAFSAGTAVSLVAGVAVLSTLFLWSYTYCCRDNYLKPLVPIDAIVGAWEDFVA